MFPRNGFRSPTCKYSTSSNKTIHGLLVVAVLAASSLKVSCLVLGVGLESYDDLGPSFLGDSATEIVDVKYQHSHSQSLPV